MRSTAPGSAKQIPHRFFVKYHPRPIKAYHLRLPAPVRWTYARDLQNSIIKAYQTHHHNIVRRPLPPTFITLQFKPVFTFGRYAKERPSQRERMMLEGLPGGDGLVTETRMAWSRERGWRYHGPGQVHFWMVADLDDWNVWPLATLFLLAHTCSVSN
jgi:lipoate-protein ligase B